MAVRQLHYCNPLSSLPGRTLHMPPPNGCRTRPARPRRPVVPTNQAPVADKPVYEGEAAGKWAAHSQGSSCNESSRPTTSAAWWRSPPPLTERHERPRHGSASLCCSVCSCRSPGLDGLEYQWGAAQAQAPAARAAGRAVGAQHAVHVASGACDWWTKSLFLGPEPG